MMITRLYDITDNSDYYDLSVAIWVWSISCLVVGML